MVGQTLAADVNWDLLLGSEHNYLEIGCYDGYNLPSVANKFKNKHIYGVDPFLNEGDLGKEEKYLSQQKINLYKNIEGYENITFYEMTDTDFLEKTPKTFKELNISSIFIDGAHILHYIKIDIEIALKCILANDTKTGMVVFHDLHIQDVLQGIEIFKQRCAEEGLICITKQNGYYSIKKG